MLTRMTDALDISNGNQPSYRIPKLHSPRSFRILGKEIRIFLFLPLPLFFSTPDVHYRNSDLSGGEAGILYTPLLPLLPSFHPSGWILMGILPSTLIRVFKWRELFYILSFPSFFIPPPPRDFQRVFMHENRAFSLLLHSKFLLTGVFTVQNVQIHTGADTTIHWIYFCNSFPPPPQARFTCFYCRPEDVDESGSWRGRQFSIASHRVEDSFSSFFLAPHSRFTAMNFENVSGIVNSSFIVVPTLPFHSVAAESLYNFLRLSCFAPLWSIYFRHTLVTSLITLDQFMIRPIAGSK